MFDTLKIVEWWKVIDSHCTCTCTCASTTEEGVFDVLKFVRWWKVMLMQLQLMLNTK